MKSLHGWLPLSTSLVAAAFVACGGSDDNHATSAGASGASSTGTGGAGASGAGGSAGSASTAGGGQGGTTGGGAGAGGAAGGAPVCGGLQGSVIVDGDVPVACDGLSDADTFHCAEKRFWLVLREDFAGRPAAYDMLSKVIKDREGTSAPHDVANVYFRRGQLAMAMGIEDGDQSKIFTVDPDFQKALVLWPDHPVVPTWRDTMQIAFAAITKDNVKLKDLFDKALANVPACPLGNIPSLTGTTIGVPLSTGIPQQTIALAKSWKCEGVTWCTDNTWKAPYAVAGMRYHFGEAYARMGMKAEALDYFAQAQAAPDYATWPLKAFVDGKVTNIDPFLATFAALGQDGSAFDLVYSNGKNGCKFCHAVK
jgi:hypothetical protein